jgi:hypothetical protein
VILKVKLQFFQIFNCIFKNYVFKSYFLKLQTQTNPKLLNINRWMKLPNNYYQINAILEYDGIKSVVALCMGSLIWPWPFFFNKKQKTKKGGKASLVEDLLHEVATQLLVSDHPIMKSTSVRLKHALTN